MLFVNLGCVMVASTPLDTSDDEIAHMEELAEVLALIGDCDARSARQARSPTDQGDMGISPDSPEC